MILACEHGGGGKEGEREWGVNYPFVYTHMSDYVVTWAAQIQKAENEQKETETGACSVDVATADLYNLRLWWGHR